MELAHIVEVDKDVIDDRLLDHYPDAIKFDGDRTSDPRDDLVQLPFGIGWFKTQG